MSFRRLLLAPLAAALAVTACAQTSAQTTAQEQRAARAFGAARKAGAPELYAFLKPFPKGADLHMHLSGAVYAETFIAEAVKQNLCVDTAALKFTPMVEAEKVQAKICPAGSVPAATALIDQHLYDQLVDAFSMRSFVPHDRTDGHDQFFATFDRFSGLKNQNGAWLDEVATRAAAQNEQYLEIMTTPTFSHAAALGYKFGWPPGADTEITAEQLARLRDQLLTAGLRDEVAVDHKEMRQALIRRRQIEACDAPVNGLPDRACDIRIHFLYQVLRGFPLQQVFAQTLLGFEVASDTKDPDFVGINFVMPEDGRVSMQDYHVQMQMLDYLHSVYPSVHISLHAGELAPGMVPPAGLAFHIREAVDLGHAERIGHGVDVLYEDRPGELLKKMAAKHIMVEVNLTSNDVILGIAGSEHPLAAYRAAHVPFALSTDDEGVSRIDLTHEYVRAALDQGLSYADLKLSARTSLEHSFLHGESLYAHPDDFTHRTAACAASIAAASQPASGCKAFLDANEKAAQQWELERRFASFETALR